MNEYKINIWFTNVTADKNRYYTRRTVIVQSDSTEGAMQMGKILFPFAMVEVIKNK